MSNVTVGVPSLDKPTPKILKTIFKAILFVSGFWALVLAPSLNLSEALQGDINKWLIVGNSAMRFIISFFGLNYTEEK